MKTTHTFAVTGRDSRSFKPSHGYTNRHADRVDSKGLTLARELRDSEKHLDISPAPFLVSGGNSDDWADAQVAEYEARRGTFADFDYPVIERWAA